jgi:hypothetical protein
MVTIPTVTFATLGPAGSNHDLVMSRYLAFRGVSEQARVRLVESFADALDLMVSGEVDYILQVAVHQSATETVARAFFRHGIYVVDTFIAPSHPLAVLTRAQVETPRTLALHPSTRDYADLSGWPEHVYEISTASVAQGLLEGRYDSGLARADLAERYPGRFRIDLMVGTVDDPWIVYGRRRTCTGDLLAWPDSPLAAQLRREE